MSGVIVPVKDNLPPNPPSVWVIIGTIVLALVLIGIIIAMIYYIFVGNNVSLPAPINEKSVNQPPEIDEVSTPTTSETTDVAASQDGRVAYKNGIDFNDERTCETSDQRFWDSKRHTCKCAPGFFGSKCNEIAHDDDFFAVGRTSLDINNLFLNGTNTTTITTSFLSFNPVGDPDFPQRVIYTTPCTQVCKERDDCIGVLFNQNSITTKNPLQGKEQNNCTLLNGPVEFNNLTTEPLYDHEGRGTNLYMHRDSYQANLIFKRYVFVTGNPLGFPTRYWLVNSSDMYKRFEVVSHTDFQNPHTFVQIPYHLTDFIINSDYIGVIYRSPTILAANINTSLETIVAILNNPTKGISTLVAMGIFIHIPWSSNPNVSTYALIAAWGTATQPMEVKYMNRPPFIPPP